MALLNTVICCVNPREIVEATIELYSFLAFTRMSTISPFTVRFIPNFILFSGEYKQLERNKSGFFFLFFFL